MYLNASNIPVIGFTGTSGSGKTTLIEKLVQQLSHRGLKVGVIKHDAHRFDIDKPGKDSWRFREAGATTTLISSDQLVAIQKRTAQPAPLEALLAYFTDEDLIIIEGHKSSPHPKVEIFRSANGKAPLYGHIQHIIAIAAPAEDHTRLEASQLPLLDLDTPSAVLDFVLEQLPHLRHP
ncbi:molybdopterin-guanine dinucleotide biosynthesis protein B [Desulfurispirillum indicum S5]|uniref:Molybdopterin-guanine dinucleotide biosynthesis protein B n=1 Tax=Desulfurispirillum indicum (strain ATCC BAA-1389 / DSM 22839 / S5) TaxID=653733 RepID=E6W5C3_DESIS|nr:molybdopterin-guanine dinucleotide biosynthesis protein B [Desulfurispirillum indicum S5]